VVRIYTDIYTDIYILYTARSSNRKHGDNTAVLLILYINNSSECYVTYNINDKQIQRKHIIQSQNKVTTTVYIHKELAISSVN